MTHVRLRGLTKRYPGAARPAVDGLDLDVAAGGLTALLGPSGCGKTTTLRMVAGLLDPTAGDVLFDGRSVLREPPEGRGAAMVFQNPLLFPHMSAAENVGFGLRMRGLPRGEIERRVAEMLALVRLPDLGVRRPHRLSGGQQQRLALARALVVRPRLLLLDEPLAALDAHLRLEMRDLLRMLQRETGTTAILVTHDQEEAVALADRIALVLDGRLRQHAAPETFFARPADAAVARFFGGRNFVPGRAEGATFLSALGPLRLPDGIAGGPGTLTVRPENIRPAASAAPDAPNRLALRVTAKTYLGTQTRLRLEAGGVTLEALANPADAAALAEGADATFMLPPEALWVLGE